MFEGAWRDVAVTDNSIVQAITGLRKALGPQQNGAPYIETVIRRGYRFLAPVERSQPSTSNLAFVALLDPHLAFIDGRAALETLDCHAVARARRAFDDALRAAEGGIQNIEATVSRKVRPRVHARSGPQSRNANTHRFLGYKR